MSEMRREPIDHPSAWRAADMAQDRSWIETWTAAELEDIDAALRRFSESGLPWPKIDRENFALSAAAERMRAVAGRLENGRGVVLLRGLPVKRYGIDEVKAIYWGLSAYLGERVHQNAEGDLIADVYDTGATMKNSDTRGYYSNNELFAHNDPMDLIGLLCYRTPVSGGTSIVASSMAIYNEILAEHPEYLETLYEGLYYYLRGQGATGRMDEITNHRIPIYSYYDGRLSCRFNGTLALNAEKVGIEFSAVEREIIRFMRDKALSPEYKLAFNFEVGDWLLLNNHVTMHARTAFRDGEDEDRRRRLLRVWINLFEGRRLEPRFAERYNTGPRRPPAITRAGKQRPELDAAQ